MKQSCFSQSRRASKARDECVANNGTGQQNQQWHTQQLIDSCINIILPGRTPVVFIYFILLQLSERLQ